MSFVGRLDRLKTLIFHRLRGYHASKNVLVYFPPKSDPHSNILLVYDPLVNQSTLKAKQVALAEVEKEILSLVSDLGQIKTETVSVERRWHEAVIGKNQSTLNTYVPGHKTSLLLTMFRLIGEGRALAIDVGGDGQEDIVVIRGSPAAVDRATKDILRIVEEAKNDAIDSSYMVEFQIPQQYVARIVGTAGANIQKYREQLDVKIDIEDLRDTGEQTVGKKKKSTPSPQSLVTVCHDSLTEITCRS